VARDFGDARGVAEFVVEGLGGALGGGGFEDADFGLRDWVLLVDVSWIGGVSKTYQQLKRH
jgi:hypothetical protein